jgi:hypothetical protein
MIPERADVMGKHHASPNQSSSISIRKAASFIGRIAKECE